MRTANISRKTAETDVSVALTLEGAGAARSTRASASSTTC